MPVSSARRLSIGQAMWVRLSAWVQIAISTRNARTPSLLSFIARGGGAIPWGAPISAPAPARATGGRCARPRKSAPIFRVCGLRAPRGFGYFGWCNCVSFREVPPSAKGGFLVLAVAAVADRARRGWIAGSSPGRSWCNSGGRGATRPSGRPRSLTHARLRRFGSMFGPGARPIRGRRGARTRARVWAGRAYFARGLFQALAFQIIEPRLRDDETSAADTADQATLDLAAIDQLILARSADPENRFERLAHRDGVWKRRDGLSGAVVVHGWLPMV